MQYDIDEGRLRLIQFLSDDRDLLLQRFGRLCKKNILIRHREMGNS